MPTIAAHRNDHLTVTPILREKSLKAVTKAEESRVIMETLLYKPGSDMGKVEGFHSG